MPLSALATGHDRSQRAGEVLRGAHALSRGVLSAERRGALGAMAERDALLAASEGDFDNVTTHILRHRLPGGHALPGQLHALPCRQGRRTGTPREGDRAAATVSRSWGRTGSANRRCSRSPSAGWTLTRGPSTGARRRTPATLRRTRTTTWAPARAPPSSGSSGTARERAWASRAASWGWSSSAATTRKSAWTPCPAASRPGW